MENENTQSEGQPTGGQSQQSAADQAAEAPEVATGGAEAAPEGPTGTVEDNEYEAEQREHLERRSDPQLPDPNEAAAGQGAETQQGNDQSQQS